jgi:gluconolactonase
MDLFPPISFDRTQRGIIWIAMLRALVIFLSVAAACAQDFSDIRVEKIAAGQKFTEGPVWSLEGFLLFSDTVTDRIQKFIPGKGVSDFATRSGGANGNAYDEQGRLYTCEFRDRRVTRMAKNGKIEVLAARFEGKRLNAPSDIVVRRDGTAYFTDPAFGNQLDSKELDFYGVYRITPKGELDAIARWKTRPHGIALAPNGRVLYVSDADARSIRAYDLDKQGAASNERILVNKMTEVPAGLRTDEKGNLYVATKGVSVYSPTGQFLHNIALAENASNLAFGDADLQSLFVTARTSVFRIRLSVKGSLPYAPPLP